MKKSVVNTIKTNAVNQVKAGIQYYYILNFRVSFDEGVFNYSIDSRFVDMEIERLENIMKECTSNLKGVKADNFTFDYAL